MRPEKATFAPFHHYEVAQDAVPDKTFEDVVADRYKKFPCVAVAANKKAAMGCKWTKWIRGKCNLPCGNGVRVDTREAVRWGYAGGGKE